MVIHRIDDLERLIIWIHSFLKVIHRIDGLHSTQTAQVAVFYYPKETQMRKTATVTIDQDNRDKGKSFLITEMPAEQAEAWATRALLAISNIDIPDDFKTMGMQGIAKLGLQALTTIDYDVAQPLLDEMMECVQIIMPAATRPLMPGDIEEVGTRLKLRKVIFELHTGFSLADLKSISESASAPQTTES